MLRCVIALFLAVILFAATAYAQRPRIVVLDHTLPKAWVESLRWEAAALHGVQFLPTRYKPDPLRGAQMAWADAPYRLYNLRNSRLHRTFKRYGPVHYLHGKTREGYLAGVALLSKEISIGYVGLMRANGDDASPLAVTTVTHEVGHNRCASHVSDNTIMNTLALHFPQQPRTWAPQSVQQMLNCRGLFRAEKLLCLSKTR